MDEKERIEDIGERLFEGEELRDVAKSYGMSCRAICRLIAEVPEEKTSPVLVDANLEDGLIESDSYLNDLE